MIDVDTSVVLAQILAEDRTPPEAVWAESLVSIRLLQSESWNRIHARGLGRPPAEEFRQMLGRIARLKTTSSVLGLALEPFPIPVRTLDALNLASAEFLRRQGQEILIATCDARMIEASRRLGITAYSL